VLIILEYGFLARNLIKKVAAKMGKKDRSDDGKTEEEREMLRRELEKARR
jgi:hypothetical protein